MNDQTTLYDGQSQFIVSYELLCLLKWLVENDAPRLKKLISKAFEAGLKKEIRKPDQHSKEDVEEVHHSIVEFLSLLEVILHECLTEQIAQQAVEKKLMPAIDQIDSRFCDDAIVRSSVHKATVKSEHNPDLNPKDLLYEELLRQWKPAKKIASN